AIAPPSRPAPPRPAPPRAAATRPAPPRPAPPPPPSAGRPAPPRPARETGGRARPAPPPPPEPISESSAVRTLPPKDRPMDAPPPPVKSRPVVRQVAGTPKPSVIAPKSFNHAQEVADKFKASQPVILNLQSTDRDLSRRLLDFCSGICYALGGNMEKVGTRV